MKAKSITRTQLTSLKTINLQEKSLHENYGLRHHPVLHFNCFLSRCYRSGELIHLLRLGDSLHQFQNYFRNMIIVLHIAIVMHKRVMCMFPNIKTWMIILRKKGWMCSGTHPQVLQVDAGAVVGPAGGVGLARVAEPLSARQTLPQSLTWPSRASIKSTSMTKMIVETTLALYLDNVTIRYHW